MNNPARNAMIICGDGTRPERNDPKTYQQNLPQPTASFRSTHCIIPSPIFTFPNTSFASFHSHISPFTLPSLCRIPTKLSHHFTPTRPYTFPSLFTRPSLFVIILPLLSMPHSASFHSPSGFLSFPFPHPFIPRPASFHLPYHILSFPFPLCPPSSPKQRPTNTIITTKVKNGS